MGNSPWFVRIFDELSRRKVFRAGAAYAVVALMVVETADIVLPRLLMPDWVVTLVIVVVLLGLPVALLVAWSFDLTAHGLQRAESRPTESAAPSSLGRGIDFVIIGVLVAIVGYLLFTRGDDMPDVADTRLAPATAVDGEALSPGRSGPAGRGGRSIAVLAFANFSDDPANAYFGDGLAEELLNRLAQVEGLKVAARTSAFAFKGRSEDVRTIGQALDVETVLEGSVRRAGDRVRVTAQLIDTRDGYHIWSQSYDRELDDIFVIQEEISQAVVDELKIRLLGGAALRLASRPTDNMEAYTLYLRGRQEWHKRTSDALERAVEYFQRAVELDPRFALAYTGLADAYEFQSNYGNLSWQESLGKSEEAARRALALDADLAEAHASLGLVYQSRFDFEAAAKAFARAIQLRPSYAMAHMWYGSIVGQRDPEAGLAARLAALELDPLSPIVNLTVADSLQELGRVEEARAQLERTVELDASFPGGYRALGALAREEGDYVRAVRWYEKAVETDPGNAATLATISEIYTVLGDLDTAANWIERARALGPDQIGVLRAEFARLTASGDIPAVRAFLDRKMQDREVPLTPFFLGAVEHLDGRYDRARQLYEQGFAIFGDDLAVTDDSVVGFVYLADVYQRTGSTERAQAWLERAATYLESRRRERPDLVQPHYWMACVHALRGEASQALAALGAAVDAGWMDYRQARIDPPLASLSDQPRFRELVQRMREGAEAELAELAAGAR